MPLDRPRGNVRGRRDCRPGKSTCGKRRPSDDGRAGIALAHAAVAVTSFNGWSTHSEPQLRAQTSAFVCGHGELTVQDLAPDSSTPSIIQDRTTVRMTANALCRELKHGEVVSGVGAEACVTNPHWLYRLRRITLAEGIARRDGPVQRGTEPSAPARNRLTVLQKRLAAH